MYKTGKFSRAQASDVQRSKSATNGNQTMAASDFGPVFDDSHKEKRKLRRKDRPRKKKNKEADPSQRKASEGDCEAPRKKRRRKKGKTGLKKTSNTNSDKKLKKAEKAGKGETGHKKSFSMNTPGQIKRILPNRGASKFSRTEKNSLQSKGSSAYADSKEASLRGDSGGKRVLKLKKQKSKFSRTDASSESDPKSRTSNKKTTHKSQNSKDVSPEKVSLETKRKLLINPTIISQEPERRSDNDEGPRRDENFESFAMINDGNLAGKFDSFVPGFAERKETLRTTAEDRSIRLDKGSHV